MYKYLEIKDIQIYIYLLLLTLNGPLQIGKCTLSGTSTPGWELCDSLSTRLKNVWIFDHP